MVSGRPLVVPIMYKLSELPLSALALLVTKVIGATALTDFNFWIEFTSWSVKVLVLEKASKFTPLILPPPPRSTSLPDRTESVLGLSRLIWPTTWSFRPSPRLTTVITELTPMITPSMVSRLRHLDTRREARAV